MGITKFIYLLITVSIVFLFYTKQNNLKVKELIEKPLISFENSIMYNISTQNVSQVIQSQKAFIHKDKEELFNVIMVAKYSDDKSKVSTNTISANYILKKDDNLFLKGNITFLSSDLLTLKTEELQYNLKSLVAKTDVDFAVTNINNSFRGRGLFLDGMNNKVIAKNTHFKIELKD